MRLKLEGMENKIKIHYDDGYLRYLNTKDEATPYVYNNTIAYMITSYCYNAQALQYVNPDIGIIKGITALKIAKYIVEHVKRNSNVIMLNAVEIANYIGLSNSVVSKEIKELENLGAITNLAKCKIANVNCQSNCYVLHPKYLWNCKASDYYDGCVNSRANIEDAMATGDIINVDNRTFVDLEYWLKYKNTK